MKKILKWTLRIVLAVILLFAILGFAMMMIGGSKAKQTYEVDGLLSSAPSDSSSLARGDHLAKVLGCAGCHGDDYSGKLMGDAPPFTLSAPNITGGNGSEVGDYSVEEWDKAIRHGINREGSGILIMPVGGYNNLSDTDAGALIAYFQSLDPVDNVVPETKLKALGKLIVAAGAPLYETTTSPTNAITPAIGPTVEYGKYFSATLCNNCHGANLEGGPGFEPGIPAPSLESAAQWDFNTFASTMRTAVRPNGDSLSTDSMPPEIFQHFTEDEMTAVHAYMRSVFN